jgi:hypothetical protein
MSPTASAAIHVPTQRVVTRPVSVVIWPPLAPCGSQPLDAVPLLAQPLRRSPAVTIRPVTVIPRRVWRAVGRWCVRNREPSRSAEPR